MFEIEEKPLQGPRSLDNLAWQVTPATPQAGQHLDGNTLCKAATAAASIAAVVASLGAATVAACSGTTSHKTGSA